MCQHFGHCDLFAFVEADPGTGTIGRTAYHVPPPHEPGVLPGWIKEQEADVVITGGIGRRAWQLLAGAGIEVIMGASGGTPEEVAAAYLDGRLETGANLCDH
jgi:predicted Fe-Mo cluster-binding NifX family protein